MSNTTDTGTGRPFRPGLFARDDAGRPYLKGSRCTVCDTIYFPPRTLCIRCLEDGRLEGVALSRHGTLHTYTVVRQGLPFFATPYILGYVDLPDGVRVFAQLTDTDPESLRIGMEMELVLAPLLEERGQPVWGYKFRPLQRAREVSQS